MSAPNTNVKKQERRHKFPLMGMVWSVVWAVVLLAGLLIYLSFSGNEPGDQQPVGAEDGGVPAEETTSQ
ncbi:hypothetical protein [Palleronia abyssalis]|mgnify:CR=1 FL=1|uniref:hypothetical protein n=1 Tax=Palleronia abyssalis TaxID=1501240 RepID=UPI000D5616E5|nr:hypothetical protein [Palleronia abyssalis]